MQPALNSIPADIVAACDYERHALARLDINARTYLESGAGDELTLLENRAAFRRWQVRPRVLRNMQGGYTRLTILNQSLAHPFLLAPVAYQRLFHTDGELAVAMAAQALETPFVVSSLASTHLEALAQSGAKLWFQLYVQRTPEETLALIRKAEASGCEALVVTVDAPLAGIRNQSQRVGFVLPPGVAAVNINPPVAREVALQAGQSAVFDGLMAGAAQWSDIEWLCTQTRLPVLLKGILAPEDALQAVAMGVAGIIVSNHGGRVLDEVPAPLSVLPEIAAAVGGRVPLLMDGGIRSGGDAFKALALGASAVLIGRPYIHALTTAGALGVAHLLRTLREELEVTMALCGCRSPAEINANALRRAV